MRNLDNDRNVIIKPADKGSSIVVWDRLNYLAEAEKQLSDSKTYKEVQWLEKNQIKLVKKSNSMFEELKKKTVITEKKRKITLSLILKRQVNYIFCPRYIRGSVTSQDALYFELWCPQSFGILRSSFAASNERTKVVHKRHS